MNQRVADGAAVISADDPTRGGDGFTVRGSSSPHPATSRPATANVATTTTRTDRTNMTPPREDQQGHHGAPGSAPAQQQRPQLCYAQRPAPLQIGNQIKQSPRCMLAPGHDGQHVAVVLDSDDNAITERWSGGAP